MTGPSNAPLVDWAGPQSLQATTKANLQGDPQGIYSVCCSHPLVIEAAIDHVVELGGSLLIEATANQVNQFGGYTGMRPAAFRAFVEEIARRRGLPVERLILGGDHLGPVCWASEPADEAMAKATALVREYAAAGFTKIHLDCSMPLGGDPDVLDDQVVADRAARLCAAVEEEAVNAFGQCGIVYVIGTEVPPPGGADEELSELEVTPAERVLQTLRVHQDAFEKAGLDAAWQRVIAVVVQPGVEFDHSSVVDYDAPRAAHLKSLAETATNGIAFEAHSTDYQHDSALAELVKDHFAILKVGPALTFALREALFALSQIEDELYPAGQRSDLRAICQQQMKLHPGNWQRFYSGSADMQALLCRYSLSDRIRYYWPDPVIRSAVETLLANINALNVIPLGLLRQYMPAQFAEVRTGRLSIKGEDLVKNAVRHALSPYSAACAGGAAR
jgi:D-tagatose-1,6-bisphosphate aldolase subunit GatZ/KbaZ